MFKENLLHVEMVVHTKHTALETSPDKLNNFCSYVANEASMKRCDRGMKSYRGLQQNINN